MLARQGAVIRFDAHLARMVRGCAVLGLPPPDASAARRACESVCAGMDRAAVRLTLTAGSGGRGLDRPSEPAPHLFATATPSPPVATPVRLALAATRRNEGSPASRLKTLSYLDNVLARREARALGADEALMLNGRGEVACAAAANLFWLRDDRLFTPALTCGVLDGIVRGELIAAARRDGVEVLEVRESVAALHSAEAIFLTNSLTGARAVATLDGRMFAPNRLQDRLNGWLAALV